MPAAFLEQKKHRNDACTPQTPLFVGSLLEDEVKWHTGVEGWEAKSRPHPCWSNVAFRFGIGASEIGFRELLADCLKFGK